MNIQNKKIRQIVELTTEELYELQSELITMTEIFEKSAVASDIQTELNKVNDEIASRSKPTTLQVTIAKENINAIN